MALVLGLFCATALVILWAVIAVVQWFMGKGWPKKLGSSLLYLAIPAIGIPSGFEIIEKGILILRACVKGGQNTILDLVTQSKPPIHITYLDPTDGMLLILGGLALVIMALLTAKHSYTLSFKR